MAQDLAELARREALRKALLKKREAEPDPTAPPAAMADAKEDANDAAKTALKTAVKAPAEPYNGIFSRPTDAQLKEAEDATKGPRLGGNPVPPSAPKKAAPPSKVPNKKLRSYSGGSYKVN